MSVCDKIKKCIYIADKIKNEDRVNMQQSLNYIYSSNETLMRMGNVNAVTFENEGCISHGCKKSMIIFLPADLPRELLLRSRLVIGSVIKIKIARLLWREKVWDKC